MEQVSKTLWSVAIVFSMVLSGIAMMDSAESKTWETATLSDIPVDSTFSTSYNFTDRYPSLEDLYGWYDYLVSQYGGLIKKTHVGYSWEGRDLWVLELTANDSTVVGYKPGVFINGNIHAREWSTSQASAYLAWLLLENYATNDTIHWLLNNRRIYIMPMSNPDGYYFDGDGNYAARAGWRKNRNDSTPTTAIGVDLNRNWDVDWANGVDDPADSTYHGEYPFSEYETKAMRDFILNNSIDSFQDIHSYAGTLLVPLCYSSSPAVHYDWYRKATAQMTSFTTRIGTSDTYTYGQPIETIGYNAPGGSIDWTYVRLGIQSYCFELYTPGSSGFYPDPSYIMTINQDVDDALLYQARIADIDLGDGTAHLYPPAPYIVFGQVYGPGGAALTGEQVNITNTFTGEIISIQTDSNGYYELNLGAMTQFGYSYFDGMAVSVGPYSIDFAVDGTWGKRVDINTVATNIPITVDHYGPGDSTDTFTLYPRGIREEVKYNGLAAYSLSKVQSVSTDYYHTNHTYAVDTYAGIRVWRRSSAGVDIEITSGTAVAVASRTGITGSQGLVSAAYTPPATTFNDGDSLVVRLYVATTSGGLTTARATFITEPMGPGTLQANQWTVSYYIRKNGGREGGLAGSYVAWGANMFNTTIANFRYSTVSNPVHHNTVNWTDAGAGVSNYWVYRSDTVSGDYELIGSVPVGTHTYVDRRKGQYDTTYWWYRVMAVGLEGKGFIAEQEPGGTETGFATATGPIGGPGNEASITYFWTGAPTSVYLYYTIDGGATWLQLVELSGAGITGSYAWTAPASGEYGWFASAQGDGSADPVPPSSGTWPQASYLLDMTPPEPVTGLTVEHWGPSVITEHFGLEDFGTQTAFSGNANGWTFSTWESTAAGTYSGTQGNPAGSVEISCTPANGAWASGYWVTSFTTGSGAIPAANFDWDYTIRQVGNGNDFYLVAFLDTTTGNPTFGTNEIARIGSNTAPYTIPWTSPAPYPVTLANDQTYYLKVAFRGYKDIGQPGVNYIANFDNVNVTWTEESAGGGSATDHNTLNWTHDGTDVAQYRIYRSDVSTGPWDAAHEIATVPVGTNTYCDLNMGQADTIIWWYIVKAEDALGNEEQNANAVQEPGGGTPYSIDLAGLSGWTFVSFPIQVSGHIETILNDTANGDGLTHWDVAKTYDNAQKRWLTYRKGFGVNTFTQVDNTMGAWVYLTQNTGDQNLTLGATGDYPGAVNITLYAGWNMVGYPSGTPRNASEALTGTGAGMVSIYQPTSPYIQDRTDLNNVWMEHGSGYWVHVPADCVWEVQP